MGPGPRKINLSLPWDYIDKPAGKVRDWLKANTNSLRALSEAQIVTRLRSALGPQISALNDGDLSAMIKEWAQQNGIRLAGTAGGPGPGESEFIASLKKTLGSIPTSIDYKFRNGVASLTATGPTLKLYSGNVQHTLKSSWGGELEFKTQAPGVAFSASMGEKNWRMELTFGQAAPNITEMESVFKKGEAALRGALGDLDKVDWRNPSKTKQVFTPYLDPVKAAVDAASKSAKLRPGDISLGGWVGTGPSGSGVAGGVQLTIVF
jgi:hypothetical protein